MKADISGMEVMRAESFGKFNNQSESIAMPLFQGQDGTGLESQE